MKLPAAVVWFYTDMLIENGCVIARVARVFNIWKFTITTTKLFFTSIEMILALKNNNNTTYPKYSSFDQGYIVNYWNANKSSITLTMIFTCHFVHDAFKMSYWSLEGKIGHIHTYFFFFVKLKFHLLFSLTNCSQIKKNL